ESVHGGFTQIAALTAAGATAVYHRALAIPIPEAPVRIITANVNGIRSAQSKGFFDWFRAQRADVLCLQETKCHRAQLGDRGFFPRGWHVQFHDAETKGYSGVAIYSKREPDAVIDKRGWDEFDREGRHVEARFGDLS